MSVELSTNAALNTHLAALPDVPPIAWPNVDFDPKGAEVWLEAMQMPRETDDPFLPDDAALDYGGVYQVKVLIHKGGSEELALTFADDIIAHFRRGTMIGPVRTRQPYRSGGLDEGSFWAIVVSIPYRGII